MGAKHSDVDTARQQVPSADEAVAAVVAAAADNDDAVTSTQTRDDDVGDSAAGMFHQDATGDADDVDAVRIKRARLRRTAHRRPSNKQ